MPEERLQKIIASFGICSRREAEKLIESGKVKVDGQIVTKLGIKADPEKQTIEVNGKILKERPKSVFYAFYKPKNIVTSLKDEKNRPDLRKFLKNLPYRVYPVGRLDFDAEGLILLTNDGEVANKIMHPKYKLKKTYKVKITGKMNKSEIKKLFKGIKYKGIFYAPVDDFEIIKENTNNSWVKITIHEGKYHQVKNMFLAINHRVLRLIRIKIGPIEIGDLKPGELREITLNPNLIHVDG